VSCISSFFIGLSANERKALVSLFRKTK
jgi:hypothetical protein